MIFKDRLTFQNNLNRYVRNVEQQIIYEGIIKSEDYITPVNVEIIYNNEPYILEDIPAYGIPLQNEKCLLISKTTKFNFDNILCLCFISEDKDVM